MIKNFCRRLVYNDFKLHVILLSNILYVEVLSYSINLRIRLAYLELPFYLYCVRRKNATLTINSQNLAE